GQVFPKSHHPRPGSGDHRSLAAADDDAGVQGAGAGLLRALQPVPRAAPPRGRLPALRISRQRPSPRPRPLRRRGRRPGGHARAGAGVRLPDLRRAVRLRVVGVPRVPLRRRLPRPRVLRLRRRVVGAPPGRLRLRVRRPHRPRLGRARAGAHAGHPGARPRGALARLGQVRSVHPRHRLRRQVDPRLGRPRAAGAAGAARRARVRRQARQVLAAPAGHAHVLLLRHDGVHVGLPQGGRAAREVWPPH
ncbi:hypothetical protein EE612_010079, partial [Oryza sativa]